MKNLQDVLMEIDESILDSEDEVIQSLEKYMEEKEIEKLMTEYPKDVPGHDAYGRKLEVGDWVFCMPMGQKGLPRQTFGVIAKITPKRLTVSIGFDLDNVGWNKRTSIMWGKSTMPEWKTINVSVPCTAVIKIINKEEFRDSIR